MDSRTAGVASAVDPIALQESFAKTADVAMKSVVHITTRTRAVVDFPFRIPEGQNIGSGVIVGSRGYILTNNHVVRGARSLSVFFVDGTEYPAKVVGTDKDTDLALLKIDPKPGANLTPIEFADSDDARVGDWALAIGSPFGYNHTVTIGIVSAKHRVAQMNLPYQDFIQTDAAINPGNSGGALVNARGELVGINTMIVSGSRSNDGVGFAISSNLAKFVYKGLVRDGRVRRGFLGVDPRDINKDLVKIYRRSGDVRTLADLLEDAGLSEPKGVWLLRVERGTPAARAGLKEGDVIIKFNGKVLRNRRDLFFRVAEVEPGREVDVKFIRNGKTRTVSVKLAERE